MTSNITAITVSGWLASYAHTVRIRFTQDGSGGKTVAFPGGWRWDNGSTVTVTATANKATVIELYSDDGGATIFAKAVYINA